MDLESIRRERAAVERVLLHSIVEAISNLRSATGLPVRGITISVPDLPTQPGAQPAAGARPVRIDLGEI